MTDISDLAAGTAAEHLVCADLLLKGYCAFLTDQICPYDVAVEFKNILIKIQVKSTRDISAVSQRKKQYTPSYLWHVKRAGNRGRRQYHDDEFDLLALVALDIKVIAYASTKEFKQTVYLRPPNTPITHRNKTLKNVDEYPFEDALLELDVISEIEID